MASLQEYRRKRQFQKTPEPPPEQATTAGENTYVVQKHAARRLHYDFRLAVGGALKSWAVPKGPSLNPGDKRLAVQTEDHPMDYAGFEGTIPEGNYGAGTVMVWDRGRFDFEGGVDAERQFARGELKFSLQGEKLRGSFALVKLKNSEKGNEWLLIKHKDDAADPRWDIDEHDGSVLTGRTLEEIAAQLPPKRQANPMRPEDLQDARNVAMPSRVTPTLATLVDRPFSDPEWLFEIKWDGVRALAWIADGEVTLRARSGADVTSHYPELAPLPEWIHARRAILDGEIVALDERGHSDFERLQQRMHVRAPAANLVAQVPVTYYVFDLLYCDGYDLRDAPLLARKELLRTLLRPSAHVRFSDHQLAQGREMFDLAREMGLEGIVGKRADSRYAGVRTPNWVKIKSTRSLDAVVGGWTAPRGGRTHFGSLLLGLYDGKTLRFIGHAGSGFDEKTQQTVAEQLRQRQTDKCPFDKTPDTNEKAFWTRPELVARVRYSGWTNEPRLRHPVFLGLRDDARPEDCRFDTEMPEAAPSAAVVHAPEVTGAVLTRPAQIESELFKGKQETVTIELEGKRLRLSHLNKVYFPQPGYTKRELLAYYYRIAEYILPFLRDRPLVLRRYPDGIQGQAFFQKDLREGLPGWFETVSIHSEGKGGEIHYAIANDLPSLLFLTNLGCIDHNPWSSRRDDLDHPDYFFFDLDPSEGAEFRAVVDVARALCEKLERLGLAFFVKTSGATGLHIYVPVERVYSYAQLRAFGDVIASIVAHELPRLVTFERTVAKRLRGTVLMDVDQNAQGRPLAAPYAVRAFPRAQVSAPLLPKELRPALNPEKFNLKSMPSRIREKGDLWADFWQQRQRIQTAVLRIGTLIEPKPRPARSR
jgi:bifunctional non-homologous end joining protein LigD